MRRSRRGKQSSPKLIIILFLLITLSVAGYLYYLQTPRHDVIQIVEAFYDADLDGDYAGAWTYFHSSMKDKFTQADYISARTTVFLEDLNARSFSYEIDEVDHLDKWRMSEGSPYIKDIYRVTVSQSFNSIFGITTIKKNLYLALEDDEWRILWEF